jgi:hypothetical protein
MDAGLIRPISVRPEVVRGAFMMGNQLAGHGHPMSNAYLSSVFKDSPSAHGTSGLQPISGACGNSHVKTLPRERDNTNVIPFHQDNFSEDEAIDDWVADFRAPRDAYSEHQGGLT